MNRGHHLKSAIILLVSVHCAAADIHQWDDKSRNASNQNQWDLALERHQNVKHAQNITGLGSLESNALSSGQGQVQGQIHFLQEFLMQTVLSSNTMLSQKKPDRKIFVHYGSLFRGISASDVSARECLVDLGVYSEALQNRSFWALRMADATGSRGPGLLKGNTAFFGNYDECLETHGVPVDENSTNIEGNYCIANIHFGFSVEEGAKSLEWHLCLPKSCSGQNVTWFLQNLSPSNMFVYGTTCHKSKDISHDASAIIAILVCCLICLLGGFGTVYDTILSANGTETLCIGRTDSVDSENPECKDEEGVQDQRSSSVQSKDVKKALCHKLLLSFSLTRNVEKLISTNTKSFSLSCIHGIRALSMAWVILGHTVYIMSKSALANWFDVVESASWFSMQAVINGTLAVDTFFLLSGCLVTLLFLRETERIGRLTCFQMIRYYAHRYWRLTPLYMAVIMVYTCLGAYFSDGPNFTFISDRENCRRTWWINFLYINNVYKNTPADICLMSSWFLAADMQFHWIAPLALIPMACGCVFIGFLVIASLLAIHASTSTLFEYIAHGDDQIRQSTVYFAPYCRVGVFAIGIGLGYILHKTKCQTTMSKMLQLLGWTLAIGTGLTCTYVTYDHWSSDTHNWNRAALLAHEVLLRPVWALAVSWIIFICCCGRGGIVNYLLSCRIWIPMGRLTYGAYLLHTVVLTTIWTTSRTAQYYSTYSITCYFLVTWILSYGLAFIFSMLVEIPCMAIEKIFIRK